MLQLRHMPTPYIHPRLELRNGASGVPTDFSHVRTLPPNVLGLSSCPEIKRIYHRSRVQTEKSQPEGLRIIPETRFTEFPAL